MQFALTPRLPQHWLGFRDYASYASGWSWNSSSGLYVDHLVVGVVSCCCCCCWRCCCSSFSSYVASHSIRHLLFCPQPPWAPLPPLTKGTAQKVAQLSSWIILYFQSLCVTAGRVFLMSCFVHTGNLFVTSVQMLLKMMANWKLLVTSHGQYFMFSMKANWQLLSLQIGCWCIAFTLLLSPFLVSATFFTQYGVNEALYKSILTLTLTFSLGVISRLAEWQTIHILYNLTVHMSTALSVYLP